MTHKELVDQVSANLFKQSGKIESQKSWLAMKNYLEQLDSEQLKSMLKESAWFNLKVILNLFSHGVFTPPYPISET